MATLKLGVLISGRGTNLQALIDACALPDFPADIALVISNEPAATGLDRAQAAGIAISVINHRDFEARTDFEEALDAALINYEVELVCLAGFMRLLGDRFVTKWRDRLINIHPSLLPAFKGLDTHERVLASGVRVTGCTVHFVRAAVDDGPIVVQAVVPVYPDDEAASLADRVLTVEHQCYPLAVRLIAEGRVRVVDERVVIDGVATPDATLLNPASS